MPFYLAAVHFAVVVFGCRHADVSARSTAYLPALEVAFDWTQNLFSGLRRFSAHPDDHHLRFARSSTLNYNCVVRKFVLFYCAIIYAMFCRDVDITNYFQYIHIFTPSRVSPYLIGIALGLLLHFVQNYDINKIPKVGRTEIIFMFT